MRVLIADDSTAVVQRLHAILSEIAGLEVVGQARNGFETIDRLRTLRPDALVLDLRMPGLSGIEVLHHLETRPHASPALVIVLTNYADPLCRRRCLELGADYFLDKTLEFERVVEILRTRSASPEASRG